MFGAFRVTALCYSTYCLDSACMTEEFNFQSSNCFQEHFCTLNSHYGETLKVCMEIIDTEKIIIFYKMAVF